MDWRLGMTETVSGAPQQRSRKQRLPIERVYTTPGVHPYDEVTWERRDVVLTNWRDGSVNFEQRGVEFPDFWSVNAANIVTTKYFRGAVGTEQRESSLRQLIDRVALKYGAAGREHGYFASEDDAQLFEHELTWMLMHQVFSFNSPVWFNVGTTAPQQVSACFILAVDDSMDSILNWYKEEGKIFQGGSGAGLNLSRIRSSKELLSSGGTASGPVSFMRGADASAGTIKSGGATRRAAKMVVLDVDHPDIEEFIDTKAREEDKIRALRDAGFDMDLGGKDIVSVQYQNANNSVRVSDEFMRAVEEGKEFGLRGRLEGQVIETVDARTLWNKLATAAWECADPGIQYDDTINDWHTNPESGRITASNPCFTGDTTVLTVDGPVAFKDLVGTEPRVLARDAEGQVVERRMHAIRLTRHDADIIRVAMQDGSVVRCTPDHLFMLPDGTYRPAKELEAGQALASYGSSFVVTEVSNDGREDVYDGTVEELHNFLVVLSDGPASAGVFVHNCSEYMSLDNSSCNLASLNLMKFLREDGTFEAKKFAKAVEVIITAMDISICFADFPTEAIGETTRAYRQLGIGYANLGALLMATGHAYDSEGGRALAGAITSLMTGTAYKRSAELAGMVGAYDGYARNEAGHKRVMRKHAAANDSVRPVGADDARILHEATKAWQECLAIGEKNGYRNAQASVIAPTGTIGLMMSCDTTGLEPDLALVKFKKLVGGASMQIVNETVPRALRSLGYQEEQVEAIVEHIAVRGHVIDAPGLRTEHYEVFDCAMGERSIAPMGHVRMMAAIQPFVSGALSKTCNLPAEATVDDVADIYFQGWKLGLKALAIYRNNSKVGQPLQDKKGSEKGDDVQVVSKPTRKRLSKKRRSQTVSFSVAGAEGYMTAGEYDDGGLGEVFIKMSKQGSTLAGVMDAFSVSISIGLQYGVPLEAFVSKYINMRFDPAGMTDDADIRIAQSVMDYLFRRLALDYLPVDKRAELGIFSAEERAAAVATGSYSGSSDSPSDLDVEGLAQGVPVAAAPAVAVKPAPVEVGSSTELLEAMQGIGADAPLCMTCGTKMRPAGSCYVCEGCGSTSGCS
jgi:ribonucleotide reductase alpha subunit